MVLRQENMILSAYLFSEHVVPEDILHKCKVQEATTMQSSSLVQEATKICLNISFFIMKLE